MGLLSALLPKPKEIKNCLSAIDAIELHCGAQLMFGSEIVAARAKKMLAQRREEVVAMLRAGTATPHALALVLFRNESRGMVTSGHYHVYRGVLSTVGSGLLKIFEYADAELVRVGHTPAESSANNRLIIKDEIAKWG